MSQDLVIWDSFFLYIKLVLMVGLGTETKQERVDAEVFLIHMTLTVVLLDVRL